MGVSHCAICGAEHVSCGQRTPMPIPPIDFSWERNVPFKQNYVATERLYLNAKGEVVRGGDPSRVSLLVPVGGVLSYEEAVHYGLVGVAAKPEAPVPPSPEPVSPPATVNVSVVASSPQEFAKPETATAIREAVNEAFAQAITPTESEADPETETTGVGVVVTQPKRRGRPPIQMPDIKVKE